MAFAIDRTGSRPEVGVPAVPAWMTIAAATSLGAGAIHAAAIGVHAEHRPAALTFTILAALQLIWAAVALVRSDRVVAAAGALLGAGAFAGWVLAKQSGISFIPGLDVAEPIQLADGAAATLAFASMAFAVLALRSDAAARPMQLRIPMSVMAAVVAGVTVAGMVGAGTHVHHHGTITTGVDLFATGGPSGHDHSAAVPVSGHDHSDTVLTRPYDPTKPIDLGGVPGVTPEQQAAAENLVADTLLRLPKWSDPAVAEAAGFRSIGDSGTGVEHFVNQKFMNDDYFLDPDHPESLVYDTSGGGRKLAAAMYMAKPGTPLADVPNIGGKLMQWHVHDNLCYNAQGRVAGLTDASGNCAPGLVKPVETPMIHVWIQKHKCGPFAALEGIGGGRIPAGEEILCDHVHGAP